MARAHAIIENPVTGERMQFHGVGAALGAEDAFQADVFARPYGLVQVAHVHAEQEERLHVLAGRLRYRIGRQEQLLSTRQTVSIPAGAPHVWWNDGDAEAHLLVELRPARRAHELFETLFALARERKTDERGTPGLLELSVLADEHGYYVAGVPVAIQRPILGALAALARSLGRGARPAAGPR